MEITQYYLTENRCYKAGATMTPKGIVVHSTGANNPNLCRYIGPDDGVIGPNKYGNHWNQTSSSKCVHAMIGKDKNGMVRCYQTLPWTYKPWGCGSGSKGSYNNSHIQFEMQEDGLTDAAYFSKVYDLAVSLCAYLCKAYGIPASSVVSHREAHDAGYASNHGDPHTWFAKQGKTMDDFRADVGRALGSGTQPTAPLYTRQVNTPGDTLNVRDAANAQGKKLGALAHGSRVEVYGLADNGWVLIQQGSLRGWVNGKYLTEEAAGFTPYVVRVTADALNIRKGPGTGYDVAGCIRDKGSYTIVEEQKGWGRLKSGAGWISLSYTDTVNKAEENTGAKPELTRVLKLVSPNMRGEDVRWAQQRLKALGYDCGTADGIFGTKTDNAVKAFQKAKGLSQDGDIGPKTWDKL